MSTDISVSDRDSGKAPMAGPAADGGQLDRLDRLRASVMECDRRLIAILRQRLDLVLEIGELKASLRLPVTDPKREAAVVRRAAELAREAGLDEELIRNLIWRIMSSARARQYLSEDTELRDHD